MGAHYEHHRRPALYQPFIEVQAGVGSRTHVRMHMHTRRVPSAWHPGKRVAVDPELQQQGQLLEPVAGRGGDSCAILGAKELCVLGPLCSPRLNSGASSRQPLCLRYRAALVQWQSQCSAPVC